MGRFSTAAQYFLEPTGTLDEQSGKDGEAVAA